MASKIAMLGSHYLESQLYKTWPIFNRLPCIICGEKFRRQWMWKFMKRRKYTLERQEYSYACHDCTSEHYNDAITKIDSYYRALMFRGRTSMSSRRGGGAKPPSTL